MHANGELLLTVIRIHPDEHGKANQEHLCFQLSALAAVTRRVNERGRESRTPWWRCSSPRGTTVQRRAGRRGVYQPPGIGVPTLWYGGDCFSFLGLEAWSSPRTDGIPPLTKGSCTRLGRRCTCRTWPTWGNMQGEVKGSCPDMQHCPLTLMSVTAWCAVWPESTRGTKVIKQCMPATAPALDAIHEPPRFSPTSIRHGSRGDCSALRH